MKAAGTPGSHNEAPKGLDELIGLIQRLENPEETKQLVRSLVRHKRVGIYNAMLVHLQCPHAELVMTAAEWRQLGRRPIPTARPLVTLRAFGPVTFVFEYNETEGAPLPEDAQLPLLPADPLAASGEVSNDTLLCCYNHCRKLGIMVEERSCGVYVAGRIRRAGEGKFFLTLSSERRAADRFATLCHELAHLFCGHIGDCPDLGVRDRVLPHPAQEAEAEFAAYLVGQRRNIVVSSEEYLAGHFRHKEARDFSLEAVIKAAGNVEGALDGKMRRKKA